MQPVIPFRGGKIAIGETVWMKWVSGPIVARARVAGIRQMEAATLAEVRDTTYGFVLCTLALYLDSRATEGECTHDLSRSGALA